MRVGWVVWTVSSLVVVLAVGALLTFWRTQWAEARIPPSGQYLELPAVRLHYIDQHRNSEPGPTLVLLHGASTNLRDFQALRDALGTRYRLLSIDRPGSGYSQLRTEAWLDPSAQAEVVLQLLQHLDINESVWVGHSLAGSVVMAGLLAHPAQVRGGVLLAGATYPWTGGVDFMDHLPGVPVIGPLASNTVVAPLGHLLLESALTGAFAPEAVTPGYRQTSGIDLYLRPSHFAATARDIRRLSDFLGAQSKRYAEITQPLLVIHGDKDDIVPAWNHADRLRELLPQVQYRRIPGGGHQPHHVHTARVAEWIDSFLQQLLEKGRTSPSSG